MIDPRFPPNVLHWQLAFAIVEGDDVACEALADSIRDLHPAVPEDLIALCISAYRSIRGLPNREEWLSKGKAALADYLKHTAPMAL